MLTADGQAVDLLQADTGVNLLPARAGRPARRAPPCSTSPPRPTGTTTEYDYPGDMVRMRDGRTLAFLGSPADGFAYRILGGADPFADASWRPWPARA